MALWQQESSPFRAGWMSKFGLHMSTTQTAIRRTESEKVQARQRWDQTLASLRIEGHVPSAEYLADIEAHIEGTLSEAEFDARILARHTK